MHSRLLYFALLNLDHNLTNTTLPLKEYIKKQVINDVQWNYDGKV